MEYHDDLRRGNSADMEVMGLRRGSSSADMEVMWGLHHDDLLMRSSMRR